MSNDIQAREATNAPEPDPREPSAGEAQGHVRDEAPTQPDGDEDDDGPDSDESGGPTAPQRPPDDS